MVLELIAHCCEQIQKRSFFILLVVQSLLVIAMEQTFKVVVENGLDGYLIAEVPELPGCYSQGKTMEELLVNIKEAIELYLESLQELDKKPEKRFVEIKEVVVNA